MTCLRPKLKTQLIYFYNIFIMQQQRRIDDDAKHNEYNEFKFLKNAN